MSVKLKEDVHSELNDAQRDAVYHGRDPLLILAGAGSGKTTTLVHRVARLISDGTPPERLLLLTFTRRSASEMLHRVDRVIARDRLAQRIWGGTFHGTAARLMRIYGQAIGVNQRFSIHDRADSEDLMRSLTVELKLNEGAPKFPKKGTCMSIHSFCVNAGRRLDEVLFEQFPQCLDYQHELEELFQAYGKRKQELSVLDYDDLLTHWRELVRHEQAGDRIRSRFDCVLVDEYQDTNHLQSEVLSGMCPDGQGLTVVGDDAQSIYSFRAATVENILDFPKHFPNTRVIKLEQNYRSTQPILNASNQVMRESTLGFQKRLWSERELGPLPQLINCFDEREQTDFVIEQILRHQELGVPFDEQAVLFRASHLSISLETQLGNHGISYVKYGGLKFVESAHVKDLMSILRIVDNFRDTVAGQRALSLMPGIGPKKASQLVGLLNENQGDFACWESVKPPAKAREVWLDFLRTVLSLARGSADDVAKQVNIALEFYEPILQANYDNAVVRLNDLEKLAELAERFPNRTSMLADLTVDPPTSDADLPQAEGGRSRAAGPQYAPFREGIGMEDRLHYSRDRRYDSITPIPRKR